MLVKQPRQMNPRTSPVADEQLAEHVPLAAVDGHLQTGLKVVLSIPSFQRYQIIQCRSRPSSIRIKSRNTGKANRMRKERSTKSAKDYARTGGQSPPNPPSPISSNNMVQYDDKMVQCRQKRYTKSIPLGKSHHAYANSKLIIL